MAAPTEELRLSPEDHSALFHELCQLHQYVHGAPLGCFSGTDQELVDAVNRTRAQAAAQRGSEPG